MCGMARPVVPMTKRFWDRVNKDGPLPDQEKPWYSGLDKCWVWLGVLDRDGYGRISHAHKKGRTVRAHRFSFELHGGSIPEGHSVLHRCDNPSCVNPTHIKAGTLDENNKDMKEKGRSASGRRHSSHLHPELIKRGEKHHNSVLTDKQAMEIKRAKGTQRSIAKLYNVSQYTVWGIRFGKTWTHLE